jgi:hypothetical protein
MKRLAILWLTLLGACWLTQAVVSAVCFQRAIRGTAALVLLAVVPLAQALVIEWMTRAGPRRKETGPPGRPGQEPDEAG